MGASQMTATYDFRFFKETADQFLPATLGVRKGAARQVVITEATAEFDTVAAAIEEAETRDNTFLLSGWQVSRRYEAKELAACELILLQVNTMVEPAGEECGTRYDESSACPYCGAGARQEGDLFLRARAFRRKVDFRRTLGGEVVVSRRAATVMVEAGISATCFGDVYILERGDVVLSAQYRQLLRSRAVAHVTSPTRFGEHPFDQRARGACTQGDTGGIARLSEVTVRPDGNLAKAGVVHADKCVGLRQGLLRPERMWLVSQEVYQALASAGVTGCSFERVHFSQ